LRWRTATVERDGFILDLIQAAKSASGSLPAAKAKKVSIASRWLATNCVLLRPRNKPTLKESNSFVAVAEGAIL
jgi:hypothetical protein